ncbi:hypothetical protein AQUCO_03300001v1 [Aquilegia coerulea]|uniref:Uncharacterized protein n=1 Tax=Aquilegia coerulea TaxID=218851 RepID=A0A2G5CZ27_AQUCA|nr:hypothetical protein AQUCO_03300001v1 [Aquilegia coerulea]
MHSWVDWLPIKADFGRQSCNGYLEDILQPLPRKRKTTMDGFLPYLLLSNDTFPQWYNDRHQQSPSEEFSHISQQLICINSKEILVYSCLLPYQKIFKRLMARFLICLLKKTFDKGMMT